MPLQIRWDGSVRRFVLSDVITSNTRRENKRKSFGCLKRWCYIHFKQDCSFQGYQKCFCFSYGYKDKRIVYFRWDVKKKKYICNRKSKKKKFVVIGLPKKTKRAGLIVSVLFVSYKGWRLESIKCQMNILRNIFWGIWNQHKSPGYPNKVDFISEFKKTGDFFQICFGIFWNIAK